VTLAELVAQIVLPVTAVLVSSGIAIGLAMSERLAAERFRLRVEIANVTRSLTNLNNGLSDNVEDYEPLVNQVSADVSVLAVHLKTRDMPVAIFVATALFTARSNGTPALKASVIWIADCLERWQRGFLKSKDFKDAVPEDAVREYWIDISHPSEWAQKTNTPTGR